jgi:hypothetical protein
MPLGAADLPWPKMRGNPWPSTSSNSCENPGDMFPDTTGFAKARQTEGGDAGVGASVPGGAGGDRGGDSGSSSEESVAETEKKTA